MNLPKPDKEKYLSASPFPHIIIENIFPVGQAWNILDNWPKKHDKLMIQEDQKLKGHTWKEDSMGSIASRLREFQSQKFIDWLQDLTGINGLVMDAYWGEGGLHETFPPGRLQVHTDYTVSDRTGLTRKLNVLIYLNEGWHESYGGNLELWDRNPTEPGASCIEIEPIFNRMVVFNTTGESYHGHSKPLSCPRDRSRKSIALYYFVKDDSVQSKITTFIDTDKKTPWNVLKMFVPPIFWKIKNSIFRTI
jgi:Rps23 Pro-64 3,4-dihydroxylase Tpa1-like proline 4-hydroxylase